VAKVNRLARADRMSDIRLWVAAPILPALDLKIISAIL
jgi:hypothetical protein